MNNSPDIRGLARGNSEKEVRLNLENLDYSIRDIAKRLKNISASTKKETINSINSAISASGSTTSTSYILCGSCTATLNCSGNKPVSVYIGYVSGGYIAVNGELNGGYVRIINTTTGNVIQEYLLAHPTLNLEYFPHGGIDVAPDKGNNIYRVEVKTPASSIQWYNIRLSAVEL